MKTHNLGNFNGPLPAKTTQYQSGWVTTSHYEKGTMATEAELFKLLGEAIEHHEMMEKSIQNLRLLLGVKS
jgi:hypothetical protein